MRGLLTIPRAASVLHRLSMYPSTKLLSDASGTASGTALVNEWPPPSAPPAREEEGFATAAAVASPSTSARSSTCPMSWNVALGSGY